MFYIDWDTFIEKFEHLLSISEVDDDANEPEDYYVLDQSILETVNSLAQKKAKDYPSLSNKAIFKYMDLVEM